MSRTAALLVVGNEILTGKIADENVAFLARELFSIGIRLRRVVVCPDELDVIAADVNALRSTHDYLFTSGGVGPTHDDITIDGVALAFGRPLTRSTEVEALIRRHYGERTTEGHLRMANVPEGSSLVRRGDVPWPTLIVENVYVLPGVPEIFKIKMAVIRDALDRGEKLVSHAVYTLCDEGEIAERLTKLTYEFPEVLIGSYLRWHDPEYRVKITFDGRDAGQVKNAADAFVLSIRTDALVRRDP